MTKVLVINTKYKNFGGEDANIIEEVSILSQQFEVKYLEFKNSDKLKFFDYISFLTNNNRNSNKTLKKVLDDFSPDIAYVHNTWFRAGLGIFKILNRKNIKILFKLHNFRLDCTKSYISKNHISKNSFCFKCGYISNNAYSLNKYFNDSYVKSLFAVRFSRKLLKIIHEFPMTVVVLNNFQKEIIKSYKKDIKTEILSNPIKHKGNNRNQYKSSSNFVVYAGTLTNEKGVDKLLESWRKSNINKLTLKIIGTGPIEDELKERFKENNIKFFGFLDNKKTLDHIREARAVVTATRMFEGQPRLLCEATSFGVPSIYPFFGGMNEYFPKDYEFSFKQYDYKDLQKKFSLLDNEKILKENSDNVFDFFSNFLSEDIYLKKFTNLVLL